MAPRSPLPQENGLDASWVRTPGPAEASAAGWATMRDFLLTRLPAKALVDQRLAAGEFFDDAGVPLTPEQPFRAHRLVWFHKPLAPETEPPLPLRIIEHTDNLVVVDKPHFVATTPRGAHVRYSALVQLRLLLDLPELAPAHRLDRLTAGVLVFTTRRELRGAYAGVFQDRGAVKTYEALAGHDASLDFPMRLTGRIDKPKDSVQARLVPGEVNAITDVECVEARGEVARYVLRPLTGKTHQLRLQMANIGLPLLGDPLYPTVREVAADDFTEPLQLIARSLEFKDPVDGSVREYVSDYQLTWPTAR